MFIPSIYKSIQVATASNGNNAISTVDPNYTRLSFQGSPRSIDSSGNVTSNRGLLAMVDSGHYSATGLPHNGANLVLIEEFYPAFFRQAFKYGTVTIASGAVSGSVSHGLTLGSKAFVTYVGCTSGRGPDGGAGLALAEAQISGDIQLSGSLVFGYCDEVDYVGAPGTVSVGYCLIDPR